MHGWLSRKPCWDGTELQCVRCANVGKITRITAEVDAEDFRKRYPRSNSEQEFRVIDGYIDILLPSISVGAAGVSDKE